MVRVAKLLMTVLCTYQHCRFVGTKQSWHKMNLAIKDASLKEAFLVIQKAKRR